jgi:hypothetical protein
VQPVILAAQKEPGMFDFFKHYDWFLKLYRYDTQEQLYADLADRVIRPAEAKVQELRGSQIPLPVYLRHSIDTVRSRLTGERRSKHNRSAA